MNNIQRSIQEIHEKKHIGLMTHVVIGYPSLSATKTLVQTMVKSGADIIELQIPFSDPLADGPTIMKACEQALQNGTRVKDAFDLTIELRAETNIPLLFMCYYNTVFHYGVEKFCKDAKQAGIDGLIVPDMSIDEEREEHFYANVQKYGLQAIQVISPASTNTRLQKVSEMANGFVYCTARQGITGAKKELDTLLESYLARVRKYIHTPLAVGFGISKKSHVESLIGKADIAVVGSKILDIVNTSKNFEKEVADFLITLNMVKS